MYHFISSFNPWPISNPFSAWNQPAYFTSDWVPVFNWVSQAYSAYHASNWVPSYPISDLKPVRQPVSQARFEQAWQQLGAKPPVNIWNQPFSNPKASVSPLSYSSSPNVPSTSLLRPASRDTTPLSSPSVPPSFIRPDVRQEVYGPQPPTFTGVKQPQVKYGPERPPKTSHLPESYGIARSENPVSILPASYVADSEHSMSPSVASTCSESVVQTPVRRLSFNPGLETSLPSSSSVNSVAVPLDSSEPAQPVDNSFVPDVSDSDSFCSSTDYKTHEPAMSDCGSDCDASSASTDYIAHDIVMSVSDDESPSPEVKPNQDHGYKI